MQAYKTLNRWIVATVQEGGRLHIVGDHKKREEAEDHHWQLTHEFAAVWGAAQIFDRNDLDVEVFAAPAARKAA